jgi:hypothetical protein
VGNKESTCCLPKSSNSNGPCRVAISNSTPRKYVPCVTITLKLNTDRYRLRFAVCPCQGSSPNTCVLFQAFHGAESRTDELQNI